MPENNKFSHQQLEDLAELDDLDLENFEEIDSEFVTYPDGSELELDDLVELEENLTVEIEDLDDYELDDDDLDEFEDLVRLEFGELEEEDDLDDLENIDDLEDLEDLEDLDDQDDQEDVDDQDIDDQDEQENQEDLAAEDDLEELQRVNAKSVQRSKDIDEARETLEGISKMLDMLIQDDGYDVTAKKTNDGSFRHDREHDHRKQENRKQIDKKRVIDAEFKEIAETTDHLDKMLFQNKEKNIADQYVSDLFEDRDWDLVLDDGLIMEKAEAILNSIDQPETIAKTQGVEKKSLSTLATALLAGGGVLVFGLATAGVVTLVRNRSKKSKYNSNYDLTYDSNYNSNYNSSYTSTADPVVHIKPAAAPEPKPEAKPEPKPEPVEQKIIEPELVEPMQQDLYRGMPPQHRYPPVRPFWMPPPPTQDEDKRMAL